MLTQELLAPPEALGAAGFLVTTWLKATALLALAGILAAVLKKSPASTRHLIWGIGLSALLVLPVLPFLLPRLNVPILLSAGSSSSEVKRSVSAVTRSGDRVISVPIESAPVDPIQGVLEPRVTNPVDSDFGRASSDAPITNLAGAPQGRDGGLRLSMVLLLVWLVGFLVSLSRWMMGVFGARMIVRRSQPVPSPECIADLADLSDSLALARRVRLLEYDRGSMPMTCGIIRPAIILPASHTEWPAERRRVVLLHELSHVKRWDCLALAVAQIACAFYWLNPLVWLAARRLRLESENACDDAVIGMGTKASAYADHLLDIARTFRLADSDPRGALTIARPSQLESRLRSILNPDRESRRRGERLQSALLSLGLLAVALGLAAVSPYSRSTAMAAQSMPLIMAPMPHRNSEKRATPAAKNQSAVDNATMSGTARREAGGAISSDQIKSGSAQDTPPDGSEPNFAEKESTFVSQRIVESYAKSSSTQSARAQKDGQEPEKKPKSDEVVQALTTALKDKDPQVRSNAIWALSSAHGKIAQEALIAALKDEDARVRAQAAWGLGMHGDKKSVEPLIATLKDSNPKVVAQAVWALGMRGDIRAVDALKGLLNNPNDHIRGQAAWALGMLLMRSSGGDGDESEDEPDGEGDELDSAHPNPHPNPHPHVHVNLARRLRPVN